MGYKYNISDEGIFTIDEALIVNYLKGYTSREDTASVETWIAESEENRSKVCQIAELYAVTRAHDRMKSRNVDLAYQKACLHIKGKQIVRNYRLWWSVAAACIGAIILSSVYVILIQSDLLLKSDFIVVEANPGVRTCINLPDGTVVNLNSGSKIVYPESFKGKIRTVTIQGEAFFQVKRNEKKPFIVETSDKRASVQVLGTSFNIQSFEEESEFTATLVDGSILVNLNGNSGKTKSKQLVPFEKVTFDKNTEHFSIEKVNTDDEIAWTKGILVFKNSEMSNVLRTLSHGFNVEFDVRNPAINKYHFTGTFNNRQLIHILDYIKISSDINYTISYSCLDDSVDVQKMKIILD